MNRDETEIDDKVSPFSAVNDGGLRRCQRHRPTKLYTLLISVALISCGPTRQPVPPGEIPELKPVSAEDEQFGHEVLAELSEHYPLESDPAKVQQVRDVVDKLTSAIHAQSEPWHVYVLRGDVQNAGATRGNHLFVWTGMLDLLQDESELATVLAHEIGHILADHPTPTGAEQTREALTGVAGQVTKEVLARQSSIGALAGLAGIAVEQVLSAFIINPESQRKELEADIIGLHLMAEAGFNPEAALKFWQRALADPRFSSGPLEFLSTHPSSAARIENLRTQLEGGMMRYRDKWGATKNPLIFNPPQIRRIRFPVVPVHDAANRLSPVIAQLKRGQEVKVSRERGEWLRIESPHKGYIRKGEVEDRIIESKVS